MAGLFNYLLGQFRLGFLVMYLPKSFLRAVMGGLGLSLIQSGIEASTGDDGTTHAALAQHMHSQRMRTQHIQTLPMHMAAAGW